MKFMLKLIRLRYQVWRMRPGLLLAMHLAERQNLMSFAQEIGQRLTDADQHGKIDRISRSGR